MKRVFLSVLVVGLAASTALAASLSYPIQEYYDRQTVNDFGTHVTAEFHAAHRDGWPTNTGFKNDFTGYHAGTDIDFTEPAAVGATIPVKAVAPGEVIYKQSVTGYGGLIVIRHTEPESVTTLYGHVRLSDSPVQVGQAVAAGQFLGNLGAPFSAETSGARKHLHFAVHKGSALDINGYAQSPEALQASWHDPDAWLTAHGLVRPTASPSLVPISEPSATPTPAPEQRGFWGSIGHFFDTLWDKLTS